MFENILLKISISIIDFFMKLTSNILTKCLCLNLMIVFNFYLGNYANDKIKYYQNILTVKQIEEQLSYR